MSHELLITYEAFVPIRLWSKMDMEIDYKKGLRAQFGNQSSISAGADPTHNVEKVNRLLDVDNVESRSKAPIWRDPPQTVWLRSYSSRS